MGNKIRSHFDCACSVARIRGLENLFRFDLGAYAPGFMLLPASQAKTVIFVQSLSECEIAAYESRITEWV